VPKVVNNAKYNKKYFHEGNSIKDLRLFNREGKNAIVIGAGPSLRRNNQLKVLKENSKKFILIACDGSLFYLLSNKIVPDIVLTFDPHPTRIIRWFGDKKLNKKKLSKDDYFARQDLEIKFNNEISTNNKIIELFDRYAEKLKIALCTSSSKSVVQRLVNSKTNIYWWNPFLDDPAKKNSITKKIFKSNGFPVINTGGNVGSACWMLADSLFNCKKIALIGMDFSYYMDTPIEATQYYDVLKKISNKEDLKMFYSKIYNSKLKKYYYSDHVYLWYKKCFIEMIKNTNSFTTNCTGGGILFGPKVAWTSLKEFCKKNS
tara:strand:- start:385 stop:1335 length:951 start_codon:yes stop_codon:yes gene_type:complete